MRFELENSIRRDIKTGVLCEVKSADQEADVFLDSINTYNTARSICGYCSCANAKFIAEYYNKLELSLAEVNQMLDQLNDISLMKPKYSISHN
jgi:hypothetical protein